MQTTMNESQIKYKSAIAPAQAEYRTIQKNAWAEYQSAIKPEKQTRKASIAAAVDQYWSDDTTAFKSYQLDRADYESARAAAWGDYLEKEAVEIAKHHAATDGVWKNYPSPDIAVTIAAAKNAFEAATAEAKLEYRRVKLESAEKYKNPNAMTWAEYRDLTTIARTKRESAIAAAKTDYCKKTLTAKMEYYAKIKPAQKKFKAVIAAASLEK